MPHEVPEDGSPETPEIGAGGGRAATHEQTVTELVMEHNRALHAFLMTRVRDEHEAREVAQEAYVRLLQLDQPGAVSFLRAYLFKTAANIAIDRARQRSQRLRAHQMEFVEEPIDRLSPDRVALSEEDLEVLKRALLELTPKCRRAFLLYRLEGWTDVQIGDLLGIKPRMVRHYITHAGMYCRLRVHGLTPAQAKEKAAR